MRIVVAANWWYRRGGAGAVMLDEAAALERAGHTVIPFAAAHPDNLATPYDRFFPPYLETSMGGAGMSPLRGIAAAVDLVYDREAARRFDSLIRDVRPDLLHLHNPSRQLSPSILRVAGRAGVPSVLTLHDYNLVCPQGQMLKGDEAACTAPNCVGGNTLHAITNVCVKGSRVVSGIAALEHFIHRSTGAYGRQAGRLIAPSRFMARLVRKAGMGASTLRVVPNGIPDEPPSSTTPALGTHILYQGRLSREKGVDQLCAAARLVPDIPILVAGDGPIRRALEATAPANVRFLGACAPDVLAGHLAAAVAVVSPSTWYENAPLSVLEALRAARPVIATELGGQPELVDASVGRLVSPRDPTAIAAGLRELWDDRGLARSLGEAGRRRYLERYTHAEHMRALLAVYAEVVPTPSQARTSDAFSPDVSR